MTAATARRRSRQSASTSGRGDPRARTEKALRTEIPFIANPLFSKFDAESDTRRELTTIPSARPPADDSRSGRLRMPAHLEQLCSAPLLTPVEERDLFCRMNYLKYRANSVRSSLDPDSPSSKKLDQIDRLMAAAKTVRNQIVEANTRLVISIVKHYADDLNPFDDLLSEGIDCLINAAEKFDFDRGFRFSTYATRAVRREVFRLVQRSHRSRSRFATGANDVLDQQLDTGDTDGRTETYLLRVNRCIAKVMGNLDEREQFIVNARYGFTDIGAKPTFTRLGEHLGVSKERVRQLEARSNQQASPGGWRFPTRALDRIMSGVAGWTFLIQVATTLSMVGLIWFVQVVHYPLFDRVGVDGFSIYEEAHQRLTARVVAPLMLGELASAILLIWYRPTGVGDTLVLSSLGLLVLLWISTYVIQVPQHAKLQDSYSPLIHRQLVSGNWFRTAAWTARGVLVLAMVAAATTPQPTTTADLGGEVSTQAIGDGGL